VGKQVQIKPFLSKEDNSHYESKALPLALQRARHAKTFIHYGLKSCSVWGHFATESRIIRLLNQPQNSVSVRSLHEVHGAPHISGLSPWLSGIIFQLNIIYIIILNKRIIWCRSIS